MIHINNLMKYIEREPEKKSVLRLNVVVEEEEDIGGKQSLVGLCEGFNEEE